MKQFIFTRTLLSLSLLSSTSLMAIDARTTTAPSSTSAAKSTAKSQNSTDSPDQTGEQSEMASWLLESGTVANNYVNGIDKGLYGESWTQGDENFKNIISQSQWIQALTQSRKPLGKVLSRTLKDQRPAMNPQGLPRGAYMVVEYNTSFEKAPSSGELLTLRRGNDGNWRVLTYQVN